MKRYIIEATNDALRKLEKNNAEPHTIARALRLHNSAVMDEITELDTLREVVQLLEIAEIIEKRN